MIMYSLKSNKLLLSDIITEQKPKYHSKQVEIKHGKVIWAPVQVQCIYLILRWPIKIRHWPIDYGYGPLFMYILGRRAHLKKSQQNHCLCTNFQFEISNYTGITTIRDFMRVGGKYFTDSLASKECNVMCTGRGSVGRLFFDTELFILVVNHGKPFFA